MPIASRNVLATDREVQNAKPRSERVEFRIKGVKNLVLRVAPSGTKSWVFLYASPASGQRRKVSIGTYPALRLVQAKHEALRLTLAVQNRRDPLLERRTERNAESFEALARRYMREHERKNARGGQPSQSTREAERLLNVDILPDIGAHKAEAVTRLHVMTVVEAVADRGSYVAADRVLGLIRAIYNWAIATGRLDVNPTLGLKKRNVSRPRARVLTPDEIRSLWLALDTVSSPCVEIRDALRLQLLLGVRIGEPLGAAKSEIDLERGVWTIPALRTKSRRELRLPLSPLATSILRSAVERAGASSWLFPSPTGDGYTRPHSATTALRRLRNRIGLVDASTHDLRRTLATGLGDMGVPDEVIERVLNHAPRTVAGRHYNHSKHFEPMRRALEAWAEHVKAIVEGRAAAPNVLPLRSAGSGS
jgi:integrase